jgi:hypothetical protein
VTSSLSQLWKLLAETFVNEQHREFAFDEVCVGSRRLKLRRAESSARAACPRWVGRRIERGKLGHFSGKSRIGRQDTLHRQSRGNRRCNVIDRNACVPDDCSAAQDVGIFNHEGAGFPSARSEARFRTVNFRGAAVRAAFQPNSTHDAFFVLVLRFRG